MRLAGTGARPEAVRRTARSKWRKGRLTKGGMLQKKKKKRYNQKMSLNCLEINKILGELHFEGAFIQEIIQSGFDTLGFKIIDKGQLYNFLICTSQNACRINLTKNRFTKNNKPLRFNEFLKSRVQGMRINSIAQLGFDRIIKMDVSTWKERLFIFIRLWSAAANVIVTDENFTICDCMFRRPKRGEVSGEKFFMEEKILSESEKAEEEKLILEKFKIRTFDDIDKNQFKEKHGKDFDSLSFNEKIDFYYSEHSSSLSRDALLLQAEKWYNVKHSKMELALKKLEEKKESFENAESLKHTGDLILTFGNQIADGFLDCTDYESGKTVHIKVDPKLNVQQNAGLYYGQYKKAVSGMEDLQHDIELSKKALESLEKEYDQIKAEKNVIKIEQLFRKSTQAKQNDKSKNHTGLYYLVDGWTILVGRNAAENDELLRHAVKGNDMWLHTRDFHGGYVFIKAKAGKSFPLDILLYAGNLAVYHSKARQNGQADLYYTQVKYLKRAKDGPKGLVLPSHEKNLLVKLDSERLRRLDDILKEEEGYF